MKGHNQSGGSRLRSISCACLGLKTSENNGFFILREGYLGVCWHTAPMRGYYPYKIEWRKGSYFPILEYVVVRKWGLEFLKTLGLFRKLRLKNWRPLKQTKTKNKRHFFIPTFKVIQLCFFAQNDSFTIKVPKTQFIFG